MKKIIFDSLDIFILILIVVSAVVSFFIDEISVFSYYCVCFVAASFIVQNIMYKKEQADDDTKENNE